MKLPPLREIGTAERELKLVRHCRSALAAQLADRWAEHQVGG